MQHLESGVVWGTVLLAAGALVVLNALGLDIGLGPFFGILLLVAGALVLFRVLRLEMATRNSRQGGGELAALVEYLQSGLVWGTLLFIAGAVLVLDASRTRDRVGSLLGLPTRSQVLEHREPTRPLR